MTPEEEKDQKLKKLEEELKNKQQEVEYQKWLNLEENQEYLEKYREQIEDEIR